MKLLSTTAFLVFLMALAACTSNPGSQTVQTVTLPRLTPLVSEANQPLCASLPAADATPDPAEKSLFPAIQPGEHITGTANAATTIIVYGDFKSEYSKYMAQVISYLFYTFPEELQIVYRPVPTDETSRMATQAAEAASLQGKFWDMHDYLFNTQPTWAGLSADDFKAWITANSAEAGLESERFAQDLDSEESLQKAQEASDYWTLLNQSAAEQGQQFYALPMLVNGSIWTVADISATPAMLYQTIAMNSLSKRQFKDCPSVVIDPSKEYIATLKTEKGDIVVQLYADKTPNTVNNFVFLAHNGWYDNVTWHRVLPGFVAQTGDPSGTGMGNPGYYIDDEMDASLKFDKAGVLAMANAGPDTNGSQFFITYNPSPSLDGSYTIFGQVLSGMDVLESLEARDPQPGAVLPPGNKLLTISIEER